MSTSDNCKDGASKSSDDLSDAIGYLRQLNNKDNKAVGNVCANCGKEGSDVTNTCNKCKSVTYCNAACKKKHRSKHKKQCERRVAQLHDEKLFKQPPPLEDCPICMIRLQLLPSERTYMVCCGKIICNGCIHAFRSRVTKKEHDVCSFCRARPPESDEEMIKRHEKRIELNDENAMYNLGCAYSRGKEGLPQNRAKALELYHRAAELGSAEAYYNIGIAYLNGRGVVADEKKAMYYWELAAMLGHTGARYNLGVHQENNLGDLNKASKHYIIAVNDGCLNSLKRIKEFYTKGYTTKDEYANALRSFQAYLDDIKSDQRDEAAAARSGSNI